MKEIISIQTARQRGLVRFFTGRVCKHGHIAERYTHNNSCVTCQHLAANKYKKNFPEKVQAYRRSAYVRTWHQNHRRALKAAAINAYGGLCACCGEKEPIFLTINHINGGGRKHRREIKNRTYSWLQQQNYPPGFNVLCWNCNAAYGIVGECPHSHGRSST